MPQIMKDHYRMGKTTALLGYISRSLIVIIAFSILLLSAVIIAVYFYLQYQRTQDQLKQSPQANEQAALLSEVGKLLVLPTGEKPNIATVSDSNKLKEQSFFVHSRNGDKLLIYSKAKEAILYDPFINKIVEFGPISFTQVSPLPSAGSEATLPPMRIAIDNGTTIVGFASKIAQELEGKYPSVTVIAKADAHLTYKSTLVIDLTGKDATQTASLAKELKAKVGKLPSGEIKPENADLLIILGN